ncbi:MAG TPA: hypothetical protein VIK82_08390 [Porticoccaceae bacterium]|jgi:hypothetical protein
MDPLAEISTRLHNVERRVDRLYHWGAAAFAVSTVLLGGYLWFLNKEYDRQVKMNDLVVQMSLDIQLVKEQQQRQNLESSRAWALVRELLKKGGVVVSESDLRDIR